MYFYTVSTAFFNVNLPCFWEGTGKPWVASDKYHFRYICWNTDVTKQQEFEIIMLYHSSVRVKTTLSGRDDKHQWEWLADLSLCLFLHLVNHQRLCIYLSIFLFFLLKRLWHIYSSTLEITSSPQQGSTVHIISRFMQWCFKNIERYVKFLHFLNLKGIIWTPQENCA